MELQSAINDFGLFIDIVGAILLWKFGLPESIDRQGRDFIWGEEDQAMIAKGKLYDRLGRTGISLLIIGFCLQLASNHL